MPARMTDRLAHTTQLRTLTYQHHNFDKATLCAGAGTGAEAKHVHMILITTAHLSVTAGCPRPLPSLLPPILAERVPGFLLLLPLLLFGRSLAS